MCVCVGQPFSYSHSLRPVLSLWICGVCGFVVMCVSAFVVTRDKHTDYTFLPGSNKAMNGQCGKSREEQQGEGEKEEHDD